MKKTLFCVVISTICSALTSLAVFFLYPNVMGGKPQSRMDLRDDSGNVIVSIGVFNSDETGIVLFDKSHTRRLSLLCTKDGSAEFVTCDQAGDIRTRTITTLGGQSVTQVISEESYLSIESDAKKIIDLALRTNDDKAIIRLGRIEDGSSTLAFFGKDGENNLRISADTDDLPSIGLFNTRSKGALGLGIKKDGSSGLEIKDSQSRQRLSLGAFGKTGNPYLDLRSSNGLGSVILHDQLFGIIDDKGMPPIGFTLNQNGSARMALIPPDGRGSLSMSASRDSHTEIIVEDKNQDRIFEFDSKEYESFYNNKGYFDDLVKGLRRRVRP